MAIDTDIPGSPESIRAAAVWLRATLLPAVCGGSDAMAAARREAGSDWQGETGEAFCGVMARGATRTEAVAEDVETVRASFDSYADVLERCQQRMAAIRADAHSVGLTVTGTTIQPPGEAPPHPGGPTEGPRGRVEAYASALAAFDDHQEKLRRYQELVERAVDVREDLEQAWERVSAEDRALDGAGWTFVLTDAVGGLTGAAVQLHGSILRDTARYFGDLAEAGLRRLRGVERVWDAARHYDDVDHLTRMGTQAADDLARANRVVAAGNSIPLAAGGLLTGVGVWYDMEHGGESAAQAVTSNVGGFAASVAAGAAIGSFGGPVGVVGGIVVGAGVGVFTSGMIDELWESGGDLDDAVMAGLDTLDDTGDALLEGAGDVGGAIVDVVGGLFD